MRHKQSSQITIYDIANPNHALQVKYQYYCMFGVNDTAYKDINENYASLSIKYHYGYKCYWKNDRINFVIS